MKKVALKIITLWGVLVICLGGFAACHDYGYEYHFSVVGENGSIWVGGEWDTSPIALLGGRKGHQLKFTATPDSGYQVKEWTFNGKIVEGNKSNSFTAKIDSYKQPKATITVEFEPVLSA